MEMLGSDLHFSVEWQGCDGADGAKKTRDYCTNLIMQFLGNLIMQFLANLTLKGIQVCVHISFQRIIILLPRTVQTGPWVLFLEMFAAKVQK